MKPNKNRKGEVSVTLRRRLGEDLAQMFDNVGRKLYADLRERLRTTIAETLNDHRGTLQDAVQDEFGRRGAGQAEEHLADWLDEVVGDSVMDVSEQVATDLESIADSFLEEGKDKSGGDDDDDGDDVIDDDEDDDDDGDQGDEEEGEDSKDDEGGDEDTEGKSKGKSKGKPKKAEFDAGAVADDLEIIKAAGSKLADKLVERGHAESAAFIKMALSDL